MDNQSAPDVEYEVPVHSEKQVQELGRVSYLDNTNFHRLADFLGIAHEDRRNTQVAERTNFLYEWGRELTGTNDWLAIAEKIKEFKKDLGFQSEGVDLTDKLWRYARLESDRRRIDREMNLLKENERDTRT